MEGGFWFNVLEVLTGVLLLLLTPGGIAAYESESGDYSAATVYGRRWLVECNDIEKRTLTCYNGGSCLAIEFSIGESTVLCACPSGFEGRHCEFRSFEDPLAVFGGIRFISAEGRRHESRIDRMIAMHRLPNDCRGDEISQTRCHNGVCFAMYTGRTSRRPFCNCHRNWTGDRCDLPYMNRRWWIFDRENGRYPHSPGPWEDSDHSFWRRLRHAQA